MGQNDEGSLGALGAFAAAGKELPCLTETGGNDEVLAAVKDGKIYASSPCSSRPTWRSRSTPSSR
jgi:ABC-type sugar transport system substrate-binding protein